MEKVSRFLARLHGVKVCRGFMIVQIQLKLHLSRNSSLGYRLRCNEAEIPLSSELFKLSVNNSVILKFSQIGMRCDCVFQ